MTSSNNDIISVCAMVPYPVGTTPSQRYRIEQWAPYLEADGIKVELYPFIDDRVMELLHKPGRRAAKATGSAARFARRFVEVLRARRYDAVLIHRAACIAGPALLERLIAFSSRPLIYDFDDAIFKLHTTEANRRFGWLKFPGKTATICRLADQVVVGNSWLAEYAERFNPRVTVVPTSIDTEIYQPAKRTAGNGRVVVGWTGSSTSQTHLEMFAPVLREITRRQDVELRVISNREPALAGIDYVWREWSPEKETEELAHLDVGIMPMPDDEWSRGKCAAKALQYMAMGTPAICSAVGANRELIRHGENGLLASTGEEWLGALESLIADPVLRERLGSMGRRTVEERYSMRRCAALFGQVVRSAVKPESSTVASKTERVRA